MADTLPINFAIPGESAIASYDYTDISEGTGVVVYYGAQAEDNGTKNYSLITNPLHAGDAANGGTFTTGAVGVGGYQKAIDLDFDVVFNLPKILKGIVRAQVPWSQGSVNPNWQGSSYIVLRVRKVSNSVESEIASNTSSRVLSVLSTEFKGTQAMVEVNVTNRNNFKIGDTLRLTIEVWEDPVGDQTTCNLYHDPMDTDYLITNMTTSALKFQVPFIINL